MCDLDRIELAWARIKRNICEDHIARDLSLQKLLQVTKGAVELVVKEDWEGFCRPIKIVENEYWENRWDCSRCDRPLR
jgi:hypothetical protein